MREQLIKEKENLVRERMVLERDTMTIEQQLSTADESHERRSRQVGSTTRIEQQSTRTSVVTAA